MFLKFCGKNGSLEEIYLNDNDDQTDDNQDAVDDVDVNDVERTQSNAN